ncbi:hypothetical protein AVEN_118617-1 [Araneus ventricosus]|uniref:Uncharacterized protein n=1 Tax=Araneus ventricosus TaxID=182803 RepID=A0A4Y2AYF1_ARAVE|nr:hypothetical protein AVEN_118617-1 [Araneus ventricosus]
MEQILKLIDTISVPDGMIPIQLLIKQVSHSPSSVSPISSSGGLPSKLQQRVSCRESTESIPGDRNPLEERLEFTPTKLMSAFIIRSGRHGLFIPAEFSLRSISSEIFVGSWLRLLFLDDHIFRIVNCV